MDVFDKSIQKDGEDAGIRVLHINEVIEEGKKHADINLEDFYPTPDHI